MNLEVPEIPDNGPEIEHDLAMIDYRRRQIMGTVTYEVYDHEAGMWTNIVFHMNGNRDQKELAFLERWEQQLRMRLTMLIAQGKVKKDEAITNRPPAGGAEDDTLEFKIEED